MPFRKIPLFNFSHAYDLSSRPSTQFLLRREKNAEKFDISGICKGRKLFAQVTLPHSKEYYIDPEIL